MWLRKRGVLLRYFFSFLLVLLIPTALLSGYFATSLNHILTNQMLKLKSDHLSNVSDGMNQQLNGILDCAFGLSSSTMISRYTLSNQAKYGRIVLNELNHGKQASQIISEIYLYSPNIEYAYSTESTFTQERFVRMIGNEKLETAEYNTFLKSLGTARMRFKYESDAIYAYFSYPTFEFESDIYLIFKLDLGMIQQILSVSGIGEQYFLGIYDDDGTALNFSGKLPLNEVDSIHKSALERKNSSGLETIYPYSEVINIDGSNFDIFLDSFPICSWNYIYICPQDEIVLVVSQTQYLMYIIILAVVLCGGIMCFLFTYLSYKPIRELKSSAEKMLSSIAATVRNPNENELSTIRFAFDQMQNSIADFVQTKGISKLALKQFLILGLAQGRITDYTAASTALNQLGITFDSDFFSVALLRVLPNLTDGKEDIVDIEDYISCIEGCSRDDIMLYAAGAARDQIIIIMMMEQENPRYCKELLLEMQQKLAEQFSLQIAISIGLSFPEIGGVSTSYMQASTAYEFRLLRDYNRILFFSTTAANRSSLKHCQHQLAAFHEAVLNWRIDEARAVLRQLADIAEKDELSLTGVRFLCGSILEITITFLFSSEYKTPKDINKKYFLSLSQSIETPMDFRNLLQEIQDDMKLCMDEHLLRSKENETHLSNHSEAMAKIQAYLDMNVPNQQFSITNMAEEFELSASYLCRLYREHAGITILEYINQKRVELAKQLLVHSDATIESVVIAVGYVNASSFIRKFKRKVGMTPGEYRERNRR